MATTFRLVWSPLKNTLSSDPQSSYEFPKSLHCELADRNPDGQSIAYVKAHLQHHPNRNVVLGVAAEPDDYKLVYHDASVLDRTPRLAWIYGPRHAFVHRLHQDPFVDPAITLLEPFSLVNSRNLPPICATGVEDKAFVSEPSKPEPGSSQPRIITSSEWVLTLTVWLVKDIWQDIDRQSFENDMSEKAYKDKCLPGLKTVDYHGYVLDADGQKIKTTGLTPQVAKTATVREEMIIVTQGVGQSLYNARTLREFLCVMYDACVLQRGLYRKSSILHRDISDGNIMIAPNDEQFYQRRVQGYDKIKYINQVLADNPNTEPRPACLVVDPGNGMDLEMAHNSLEVQVERTGTPQFIAYSACLGNVNPGNFFHISRARMPTLEGQALRLHQKYSPPEYTQRPEILSGPFPDEPPPISFARRLFHDAESVFWIIAWFLVNSAGPSAEEYSAKNKPLELFRFISAMNSHTMNRGAADSRPFVVFSTERDLRKVLHPDLCCVAGMLTDMRTYVSLPEWGYVPELDPEHVHEALMRLLLKEIVRIDEEKADVRLAAAGRLLAREPQLM
ncbi:hypothetical protein FRC12_005047 [Ceratobasidium sp. 428]|nr:hypothetical protein FRC12_005047 [Ceratobasidium sp. 428]